MAEDLGGYITREYGLLKQILSNLNSCDLGSAKQVCSAWSLAVESLVNKNPTWMIGRVQDLNNKPLPKTLPAVVLQCSTSHLYPAKCKICKQSSNLCPQNVSDKETLFVTIDFGCNNTSVPAKDTKYTFWKSLSVCMFPSSDEIQVSSFVAPTRSTFYKELLTDEVVRECTCGDSPIKCLLIISKANNRSNKARWMNQLINHLVIKQGPTFAVGGGDVMSLQCYKGLCKEKNPGLILITFRGDNVTAHSDLLAGFSTQKFETLMQEMAIRVGPLPENSSRMAFIAQCVDRTDKEVEKAESYAFANAFPSVPQFGFRAYGEYGMRSQSNYSLENFSSKKMKMSFDYAHTTSFVILTFKQL